MGSDFYVVKDSAFWIILLDWVWRGNLATPLSHILGRIPANIKFEVVQELADGSYMSWIAPDRQSKKKGATRIPVRVIEYKIEENGTEQVYRLITDLVDIALFPALLLAREYHLRDCNRKYLG